MTQLSELHPGMVEEVISMLRHMEIDGETKVTRYGKIKPIIDENNYPLFEGLFNLSSDIINKNLRITE